MSPGAKYFDWETKGMPLRMEIGPKDVRTIAVVVVPRVELEIRRSTQARQASRSYLSTHV